MARRENKIQPNEEALRSGIELIKASALFNGLYGTLCIRGKEQMGKMAAIADRDLAVYLNKDVSYTPKEWAYIIAHCLLHFAFGHFSADHMPAIEVLQADGSMQRQVRFDQSLWNFACDVYIARFLADVKFGTPISSDLGIFATVGDNELKIYQWLLQNGIPAGVYYGTAKEGYPDMQGLDRPVVYQNNYRWEKNPIERFAEALKETVSQTVSMAGGHGARDRKKMTRSEKAAEWFMNHYPLLGGLAAGFQVIEDSVYCTKNEISIAAVDVSVGEIYVNPAAKMTDEELRFVLAHEYLHAGLQHYERCMGRDRYLWNVACDYVINGWLNEMFIGKMPEDTLLYDPELKGQSAEEIYDRIVREIRKYRKLSTFCGYGKGDVIDSGGTWQGGGKGVRLDEFCRNALQQGLEYHMQKGRGLVPSGLIEEIRALAMPPIPWDVELGRWFDMHFLPLEARRTYARPSRRQGSTPDIPRPRYVAADIPEYSRTFGVVVDTSGSMSAKNIGYALGAIASYADAKEVPYARVIFCDAKAYDAGYIAPQDIAGRVEVQGRGGTILQPGVDLLLHAKDFPKDAPLLIITDGMIESDLSVKREHAFLLTRGARLPFKAKGKVFYFENK